MQTFRFRQFPVYQDAKRFRKLVRKYLRQFPPDAKFLRDQIERAANSVVLNIAEGSAKKSDKDFGRFLEISIASVSEVVAGFDMACDDQLITQKDLILIEKVAEGVAKQLGGFIKKVKFTVKS